MADHEHTQSKQNSDGISRRPGRNQIIKIAIVAVVVIVVAVYAGLWLAHRMNHVSSSDARVATHEITVSSRIAGRVRGFSLRRGDQLDKKDTVAQLDNKPAKLKLKRLQSKLAAANAKIDTETARLKLADKQTQSGVKQAQATLAADQANLKVAQAKQRKARDQAQRAERLYKADSISKRKRNRSRYTAQARDRSVKAAKQKVQYDKLALSNTKTGLFSQPPVRLPNAKVTKKRLKTLRDQRAAAQAAVKHQKNHLDDLTVQSPIAGVVDKRFVNPKEYVSAGQPLIMAHEPKNIWIEAKIKETKIDSLQVDQSVDIHVDARPDTDYQGRVEVIGKAATNQFNLLPPPNPSGNFTKITQRIPVRIEIQDGPKSQLSPGMMVEVDIDISGDDNDKSEQRSNS